jgi:hypothetical protein
MSSRSANRLIEDCRGDFESIAAMMEASWAASETPPFLYTPSYLASCFEYPGASFSLAPTIYDGATPVAFVAGFPRRIRLSGRDHTILLISLLTAAAEHRNKGYGIVIWSELVKRARAAGFDGMVNYCVEGEAMNRMIVGSCRRLRLAVERIYSVGYLSRLLQPSSSAHSEVSRPVPVDAFMEAAAPIAETASLARLWTREEANWQCTRAGAVVTRHRADGLDGVLSGYVMQIANAQRTKCLVVDDLLWGGLGEEEQHALVSRFVAQGAAAGARIAVVPRQSYADTGAFTAAGFRPSGRIVHMYLTVWSDGVLPESVPSCYLDVF